MIIAEKYPPSELINLTNLILSDLQKLSQVLDPPLGLIINPLRELIIAEKDPLNESIELTNSILVDLHKLSHIIMAEGKDFKSDLELVEWKKKLRESCPDIDLNPPQEETLLGEDHKVMKGEIYNILESHQTRT